VDGFDVVCFPVKIARASAGGTRSRGRERVTEPSARSSTSSATAPNGAKSD
jgi:hypothetical protein